MLLGRVVLQLFNSLMHRQGMRIDHVFQMRNVPMKVLGEILDQTRPEDLITTRGVLAATCNLPARIRLLYRELREALQIPTLFRESSE
jgi:hypothetical protein